MNFWLGFFIGSVWVALFFFTSALCGLGRIEDDE